MIEFAISFVFLGVIVFGTVDLGRAFITWNQVKNAAREGAAYAERDPWSQSDAGTCSDPNNIEHLAQNERGSAWSALVVTTTHNGTAYSGCKDPATFPIASGDKIEVKASTTFTPLSPLGKTIVGTPTISAEVEVVVQ